MTCIILEMYISFKVLNKIPFECVINICCLDLKPGRE